MLCLENTKSLGLVKQCRRLTCYYLYWSVMDNYEWAEGYDPRFGLIYVDYRDQSRILKDSALWYKTVIETNGENL